MLEIVITKSKTKDKKYDAIIDGQKTIHFGAKGYSDFTIHKDEERKDRYINRHKKTENWNDPKTAGFYAKNILWNKKSVKASVEDTNKRFKNIHIKLSQSRLNTILPFLIIISKQSLFSCFNLMMCLVLFVFVGLFT